MTDQFPPQSETPQVTSTTESQDPTAQQPVVIAAPSTKKNQFAMLASGIAVILIIGGFFFYRTELQETPQTSDSKVTSPAPTGVAVETASSVPLNSPTVYAAPSATPTLEAMQSVTLNAGDITWLDFPQVTQIPLFNKGSTPSFDPAKAKFHIVASFSDGSKLINAYIPYEEYMSTNYLFRVIQTADKKLVVLPKYSNLDLGTEMTKGLFAPTVGKSDQTITGLDMPKTLELNSGIFNRLNLQGNISFANLKNPQVVVNNSGVPLYVAYSKDGNTSPQQLFVNKYTPANGDMQNRFFFLKLKDNTIVEYEMKVPFTTDDNVPKFTYLDGTKNTSQYAIGLHTGGCGSLTANVIQNGSDLLKDVTPVGKITSTDGVVHPDLFQITNPNSPLVKLLYDFYKLGRNDTTQEGGILTLAAFATKHNHFLWQDNGGDWIPFMNEEFHPPIECGKPVIYLYPPKEQQVRVQVGAKITVSEPSYPTGGWQVKAHPNGDIFFNQNKYSSLFWEGKGLGIYPDYRDKGVVVAQDQIEKKLTEQMTKLGLNQKEQRDFLEFWLPHMPTSPYVRLTWLNTQDMDNLAPLAIQPKPDTVARVFLETEGMVEPRQLTPQVLKGFHRKGFTVVEWGGLLVK